MKKLILAVLVISFLCLHTTRVTSTTTACSTPSFAAAPSILATSSSSGNDVFAMALGDLNNDGRNDIVTANSSSNSISVILASGASFGSALNIPVSGSRPISVAVGDLNNDNKLDVVTVNVISHNLSILLGDGAGGFATPMLVSGGSDPLNVVIANFNNDGNLDLAITNGSPASVNILLGDGAGGFGASVSTPVQNSPFGLTAADFNIDGNVDLALTIRDADSINVLLGDGTGHFVLASSPAVGTTPGPITAGDFNGDGKPDLAVGNSSSTVSILMGIGNGNFNTSIDYPNGTPTTSVATGDFNNDGNLDFAAGTLNSGLSVRLGDGTGNFSGLGIITRALGPFVFAVDDFNRDGKEDVITAGTQSDSVTLLVGDGLGTFLQTPTLTTGTNSNSVALADFNGDTKLDSVVANESNNTVSVRFGTGTGIFGAATNFAVGNRPFWLATGDFNNDTKPDIVTANFLASLSVLINDGTGNFGAATSVSLGSPPGNPLFVAVGDVNNDNKADLLATRNGMHVVTVLLGNGAGGFGTPVDYPTAPNPQTVALGDFNGDNKVDLAVADNSFSILLGDGLGAFAAPLNTNFGDNTGPAEIVASDFNGDSKLDLALANMFTNDVSVMLGNGNATFAPRLNFKVGLRPKALRAADLNNDGILDLVAGNTVSGNLTVLLGTGAGTFGTATNWAVPTSPNSVAIGDLNADGRNDVVTVGFNALSVLISRCGDSVASPTTLVSVNDVTIAEGNAGTTNATFNVSLNAVSAQTVSVKYVASPMNSQKGVDFQATTGTVTFAPGETTKPVEVPVIGDTIDEFDEKFSLDVYDPTNALIADRKGVATITDNDQPPTLSTFNVATFEDGGLNLTIPVNLSQASGKLVSVSFATADGTATAGSDYVATTGTVNIPAGLVESAISIPIIGDTNIEPDETIVVNLSAPTNASLPQTQALGTILNDDTPALQLVATTFNIGEGSELVVNVTRVGNPAVEAFVSYATADGTANDRRDYTAAVGRLRFAPGETSKSIRILITDDAYNDDGETFTLTLTSPINATLGNFLATITIDDNDTSNGPSPVKNANFSADFFVRQHYADFLNRTPDTDGLNFWIGQTTACGNPDPVVCRINVSGAFFLSIEFQETGYLVYRTHKSAFGNVPGTPIPIRLRPFLSDARQIGEGVQVNVGNWRDVLEANQVAYFNEFVQRPQFTAVYGALNNAAYVDTLNTNTAGALSQAERDNLVAALNGATMTRAQVLRAVADDQTLKDNEFRKAFVLLQYFGYLRRDPDSTPDTNFDGYNFWLTKLNDFNGSFINAEMVKAFIESGEYIERFGQ